MTEGRTKVKLSDNNTRKNTLLVSIKSHLSIETIISISTFVILGLSWYLVTKFELVPEVFIPSPAKVLNAFTDTLFNGYKGYPLMKHLGDSMYRLLTAFAIALITAIPLGLLSGYNSKARAVFDPIVEFYQSLPPLAYYTILIIWLGIGNTSKITLLCLAAFAPLFIASMSAVKSVKEDYVNGAYTLGANKGQVFRHVIFPACLPYIFTGIRTAMATSYGTLVAAEMVAATTGIGWMVFDASRFMRSDIIFMGIIVMGVTSIILDRTIRFIEYKVVPWKGKE
jgi:taurine transport system permease protein